MKLRQRFRNAMKTFTNNVDENMTLQQLVDFLSLSGTSEDALSEATYFACMKVLGEGVGKLPLKLLQYNDRNGVVTARDHPLYNVLKNRPNPYMTSSTFWSTVEYNRNHFGNAYVLITGAADNIKLWILESSQIQVWYDDGKIISAVPDVYYIYSAAGKQFRFTSEEILHFKTSNTFDGIVGVSVKDQLKSTISGNAKAQNLVNKMYDSGFTAKAVMQYTGSLSDDNVKKFVKGIESYSKGELASEGIENIIPIPLGATLTPLNVKLADNQFIEVKQYSALQIASAFGIKPYQIGDYTKASYASAEAQQLSFYVDTLLYIIKQYEEELTYKLLSDEDAKKGLHFKFNVSVILRADLRTQIEMLSKAVNGFIYTPNEARNLLDLEDKEGGDQLLGNGASIPIQYAGARYANIGQTPPTPSPPEDVDEDEEREEEKSWMKKLIADAINKAMIEWLES